MEDKFEIPENEAIFPTAKSSVKLIKNSKGTNWEIKCVVGESELLEPLMVEAVRIHKILEGDLDG